MYNATTRQIKIIVQHHNNLGSVSSKILKGTLAIKTRISPCKRQHH